MSEVDPKERARDALEGFIKILNVPEEPFADVETAVDKLEAEMTKQMIKMESLVSIGQRMANLLDWFQGEFDFYNEEVTEKCNEAQELIFRWNKEFKSKKNETT